MTTTRRQFLIGGAATAGILLAGCGTSKAEKEARKEGAHEVETAASRAGIDVHVEPHGGWSQVTYISGALSATQVGEEIYTIVEAYVTAIEDGYPLGQANVDVYNTDGVEIGEWKIKQQWIDRYLDGTLTMDGVYQMTLGTIET